MESVSFISIEDNSPDLILSFAIWQPDMENIRSLILIRTPPYEFIFDESERGVKVSDENWENDEDEMLKKVVFDGDKVTILTDNHKWELDIRKVDQSHIEEAQNLLRRMNFDNRLEIRIV